MFHLIIRRVLWDCRLQVAFHVSHYSIFYICSGPAVLVCRYKPLVWVTNIWKHLIIWLYYGIVDSAASHISHCFMFYIFKGPAALVNHLCRSLICEYIYQFGLYYGTVDCRQHPIPPIFLCSTYLLDPALLVCRCKPLEQVSNICSCCLRH